ncbi:MAG: GGDEF domain-containing protein [Planctomycetaceae bacterium]
MPNEATAEFSASDSDRRRARLLGWLIVGMLPLMPIAIVLVYLFNEAGSSRRDSYPPLISGLTVGLGAAYLLNRAGRYGPAALLTVACAVAAPWGTLIFDPLVRAGDSVPLTYVAVSVLLCGILLSARTTAVVAGVQIVGLCLLPALVPETARINWPSFIVFVLFVSVLSVVANVVRRKDLEQIDRQTDRLTERHAQLREQSVRDPLTGLFNRRYLEEVLEQEARRAARQQAPLGVIMLDIDRFKQFNDTHGHAAGDELLREVGQLLREHLRQTDIACRFGGEEFTLILPGASLDVLRRRAERIRSAAEGIRLKFEGRTLAGVTLSLGIAEFPRHGSTGEAVLRAGDAALYQAKREGRDRVVAAT